MTVIKFSIVVPLYNKAQHIRRALDSVYAQTYPPFELIIVDDVSTDYSFSIAKEHIKKLQRQRPTINVTFLQNKNNLGPGASRNRGIEVARGDYLLFLDADDEYKPKLLQKIQYLAFNASADVVIFAYRKLPSNILMPPKQEHPGWLTAYDDEACVMTNPLEFVYDRSYPVGPGSNVAVRKTIVENLRYDESAKVYEGIDFWFRIIRNVSDIGGKAYYLLRDYHIVHAVSESLIRKPLSITEIEHPKVLRRYTSSTDKYELQLQHRVAKIWFSNSYSRLTSTYDKLKFAWQYKRYLKLLFYKERLPN
ncbi:MAG: glycosyltransferase involved in cell wall biosynthesis [Arenicella sp.]|jgi:glycosyltransferase involved in cell wall biosynthesis